MKRAIDPALLDAADGLPFLKVSGDGNDFVLVDNRNGRLAGDLSELVRRVCHRGLGVGADGVILLGFAPAADLRMTYYNSDGGAADFCGNGVRCVARWAARTGSLPRLVRIETGAGPVLADGGGEGAGAWLELPLGGARPERKHLDVGGRRVEGVFVRVGVPHLAVEAADAFAPGALDDAPALRAHPALGPEGANVDVFTPRGGLVDVRFYERGVEGETLSSGSGSIAAAVAAVHLGRAASPVACRNREGRLATVRLREEAGGVTARLEGEARILFRGRLTREMLA